MKISHLTDSNYASEILFDCLSEGMRSLFMMKIVIFLREFIAALLDIENLGQCWSSWHDTLVQHKFLRLRLRERTKRSPN